MLIIAPIFSAAAVSVKVRLTVAIACTLVIAPLLSPLPAVDVLSLNALFIMINQILIGITMGFALQLMFAIFVTAGHVLAMQMGLGFSMMNSPQDGVQITVLGQFYLILATLLFLALDGHLQLIKMLHDSFTILPVGEFSTITREGLWMLVSWGSQMFLNAVMVVLPAIAALLMVNVSFGVMAKASPQLNPFSVGFVITIIFGFVIVYVTLPAILPYFNQIMEDAFTLIFDILTISGRT